MTPQEFEKIALWMGWEKEDFGGGLICWSKPHSLNGGMAFVKHTSQTSLTDAECIEALNRLVERGYGYGLAGNSVSHGVAIFSHDGTRQIVGALGQPTINQAVEQAIAALIKAERGKE